LRRKRKALLLRNPLPPAAAPEHLVSLPLIRRLLFSRAFLPCLALFLLCYYAVLVTSGSFVLWAPAIGPGDSGQSFFGFVFNSMLLHLLRGDFTIDPDAIKLEAVIRNGEIFTYFGVMPAVLRLPLVPFVDLARIDVSPLSCCIAASLAALFNVSALRMACTTRTARARSDVLVWALIASFVLGGPSVPFLKASVYQEAILWEGVFASAFLVLALRGLTAPEGFSPRTLLLMAIAAGCCLLTRVVMATGLYAATLALLAWRFGGEMSRCSGETAGPIRPGLHAGFRLLSTPRFMVPLMGLALFASAAGFINHKRFGNPLVFHNPTLQTIVRPHGVPALERYGEFNPRRIPYALMYYFAPVWFIHSDDGDVRFNDYRRRELDLAEPPPSSFFVSDPLLLVLAAAGFSALLRRDRVALSRPATGVIAAALTAPPVLMLMAFVMAFRYRMEFYPLFVFLALIGAFGTKPEIAAPRPRSATGLVLLASFGIIVSHLVLGAYKLSPWGNLDPSQDLLQIYQTGLHNFLARWL
jgi:hypothetical protein